MTRTVAADQPVSLHRVLFDWGEGASDALGQEGTGATALPPDATWLHRATPDSLWTAPGGDFEAIPSAMQSVGGIASYTWSSSQLVADVQSWLDEPDNNFGWLVLGNEDALRTAKRFAARENSNPALRPVLSVTYSGGTPTCAVAITGDVNLSSDITSSDIIFAVNYVFKGGQAPNPCGPRATSTATAR
jgi:hypothetical protein